MGEIVTTILIVLVWIISFVEPSGWASSIHLPEKINICILVLSIIFYLFSPQKRQQLSTILVLLLIVSFVFIPVALHNSWQGASYLASLLTVYIVSQGRITSKVIKYTGFSIAVLGLFILFIYTHGTLLNGWNDNAVSMTGLFSLLYFSILLIQKKGSFKFWGWNIITYFYLVLLFGTDCRSGILFGIISVVGILYSRKVIRLYSRKLFPIILLNIPLLIALIVILISTSGYFHDLNDWSFREFGKPIFNGRESLWELSIMVLDRSDYLGTGKFIMNYHNSGIAALSVFGVIGYITWISYFNNIMCQLGRYINDDIVFGSIFAFSLIFLQQTVDLGFISPIPNLLPYMILGVGLGRIRLLRESNI
ncbi:hypothetical protein [uncultured Muribaculum sp.]|uniref:hypothetical protein n=1 Tax=uncultured Muribaculum sp. TaxID=1918613 RepID=UPI00272FE3FF|nr:hypothetical protein [uncultured Muribaculum sp.]